MGHAVAATISGILAASLLAAGLCAASIGELKRKMSFPLPTGPLPTGPTNI